MKDRTDFLAFLAGFSIALFLVAIIEAVTPDKVCPQQPIVVKHFYPSK